MSLSRILNDDPSPPIHHRTHHITAPDHSHLAPTAPLPPSPPPALSRHHSRRYSHSDTDPYPRPRSHAFEPPPFHGAGGIDPYAADWVHGGVFPLRPGTSYYSHRERDRDDPVSPDLSRASPAPPYYKDTEQDTTPRKRRKGMDDDADYQPPTQKRHGPRRQPPRGSKHIRTDSPSLEAPGPDYKIEELRPLTEEELRLASSDLEDCEEIWLAEFSDYIIETQKRQKQVEVWFDASVLERNSATAQALSRHYSSRIARIPPPPLSPPPPAHVPSVEDDIMSALRANSPVSDFADHLDPHAGDLHDGGAAGLLLEAAAEDAARELEESLLGVPGPKPAPRAKGKGRGAKRPAAVLAPASDASSDLDVPPPARGGPVHKRRRVDKDSRDIADELERAVGAEAADAPVGKLTPGAKGKGKGKAALREESMDSTSAMSKTRKKPGPKKKNLESLQAEMFDALGGSAAPSASGDVTPAVSRPTSPALTNNSNIVYELDDVIPPLKRAKKVDDALMQKRLKSLEEAQRKVWTSIAKRDVAKVYKYQAMGYQARQAQSKRLAVQCSMQARRPYVRTPKAQKELQGKAKRLMREMLVFWKKNEREERDVRRREQKEALDRAKIEEEKREAARQARKLEFLISQTELYSHFVGSKLKTAEVEGEAPAGPPPTGATLDDAGGNLHDIDYDDEDTTNMHRHARRNAQEAVALARQRAQLFDTQAALDRKTNEALALAKGQAHLLGDASEQATPASGTPLVDLDSDELNFQNPTSLSGPLTIKQPQMLMAQLKEYQLKGLNWLATLYEQGINGILADEMGLGKTVQSISLLAYLAETHDIWGPFLVVAPASTLHNWQQEITRFVPGLKALPYWGNVKDRATLRKFWSKKEISYNQDAPFHVLITSYQLVTQDQQYFQRVKWQYMILDEAQNIKNSSSVRWKTLLGFHCRNRLLLTGTPIQNSMQELWALLHFIMPSLFDSHDEFNEWFSKDIENAAENKGSKLNEHQLRRLHMILKPFMLRRVKRHVQNELSDKIEKDIYVDLSARQRALYKALLANVSVADLLEKAANIGDADSARSLMNLVMQFRKVCNHPELFERADVVAPFSFSQFGQSGPLNREGDFVSLAYSTRNPIELGVPELLCHDGGLLDVPREDARGPAQSGVLSKLMNIWATDWIERSMYEESSSSYAFLRLLDMSPGEAHTFSVMPIMRRRLLGVQDEVRRAQKGPFESDPTFAAHSASNRLGIMTPPHFATFDIAESLPPLDAISSQSWSESCLSRSGLSWFVPAVVAPPISLYCTDRSYLERQWRALEAPLETLALYGMPPRLRDSEEAWSSFQQSLPGLESSGLIGSSPADQLPLSTMQVPEAKRLIYDSAKLARLDTLLQELKAGDHRVLVYFQMTRMMDLMEEYLIYRQYKYLRLDGSSKLEDRRDMVIDWQTRPDIFVFLLSTRAGGLGINLTAADTVVFYDHDWNPSNDAQAMDRAHRLGQTRQVTVYRLITQGTIDERIVQLARVKKDVQDIVVGNKNFTDVTKPSEIVQLLLNDDQLANLEASTATKAAKKSGKRAAPQDAPDGDAMRDLWNEEGDEFFGAANASAAAAVADVANGDEEDAAAATGPARGGKKRKAGASSASRGRKSKSLASKGKGSGVTTGDATPVSVA